MQQSVVEEVKEIPPAQTSTEKPLSTENIASGSERRKRINWTPFLFITGVHVASFLAIFTFSWQALALCIFLHWLTGGVGITLGFHRLLTHRSFQVPRFLEYVLTIIGSLACEGPSIAWVAAHRVHHNYSDKEKDPHSPVQGGFWWAHMTWCVVDDPLTGKFENYAKHAPDLAKDPIHVFINKFYILWTIALAAGLYAWGGWSFVIWGVFLRLVVVYHSTWFVNSAAHIWGYRTYDANDDSTNLWWVALISYGEGWHNNHHAFQYSARHGLQWWEIDTTYWLIKFLGMVGLAKGIKLPPEHALAAAKMAAPAKA